MDQQLCSSIKINREPHKTWKAVQPIGGPSSCCWPESLVGSCVGPRSNVVRSPGLLLSRLPGPAPWEGRVSHAQLRSRGPRAPSYKSKTEGKPKRPSQWCGDRGRSVGIKIKLEETFLSAAEERRVKFLNYF